MRFLAKAPTPTTHRNAVGTPESRHNHYQSRPLNLRAYDQVPKVEGCPTPMSPDQLVRVLQTYKEFCCTEASVSTFTWYWVIDLDDAEPDDDFDELEDAAMSVSTPVSATPDPTCQATRYSGAPLPVANADAPS